MYTPSQIVFLIYLNISSAFPYPFGVVADQFSFLHLFYIFFQSTPEKDKIDSKRMHVKSMTEKGEVSFAKECKRLLDLRGEIGTKGDKKHSKREAKARLKHK